MFDLAKSAEICYGIHHCPTSDPESILAPNLQPTC